MVVPKIDDILEAATRLFGGYRASRASNFRFLETEVGVVVALGSLS